MQNRLRRSWQDGEHVHLDALTDGEPSLWSVMTVYITSQICYQDDIIQDEDHADGYHLVSQIHSYRHKLNLLWLWCTNLTQS